MIINRQGCTRVVILTRRYALKLPNFFPLYGGWGDTWRSFLQGLLANQQERKFSKAGWPELCPVLFYVPLGLLVVMPRAEVLSEIEFAAIDYVTLSDREDYVVPAENKANSWARWNGRIVAIDYGN